jgi:hypothetical protein
MIMCLTFDIIKSAHVTPTEILTIWYQIINHIIIPYAFGQTYDIFQKLNMKIWKFSISNWFQTIKNSENHVKLKKFI